MLLSIGCCFVWLPIRFGFRQPNGWARDSGIYNYVVVVLCVWKCRVLACCHAFSMNERARELDALPSIHKSKTMTFEMHVARIGGLCVFASSFVVRPRFHSIIQCLLFLFKRQRPEGEQQTTQQTTQQRQSAFTSSKPKRTLLIKK